MIQWTQFKERIIAIFPMWHIIGVVIEMKKQSSKTNTCPMAWHLEKRVLQSVSLFSSTWCRSSTSMRSDMNYFISEEVVSYRLWNLLHEHCQLSRAQELLCIQICLLCKKIKNTVIEKWFKYYWGEPLLLIACIKPGVFAVKGWGLPVSCHPVVWIYKIF